MNRTYQNLKLLIEAGRYELEDMFEKLDLFFAVGRITADEYIELTGLIEPAVEEPAATEPEVIEPEEPVEADLEDDTAPAEEEPVEADPEDDAALVEDETENQEPEAEDNE